jgi:DNA-binding NarL/FixJ family response regulator
MNAVRVALVDDHEVVALAVSALVNGAPGLAFVGHHTSVGALLREGPFAELVVLDLNLRDDSTPPQNVARLEAWGARVLVLTSGESPFLIREVSRSGALGIVRKSAPAAEILEAIVGAAAGEPIATTEWAAAVDSDPDLGSAPLTEREREVLALYASGLGAKQVARRLSISENTVDDHIRRIRQVYGQLSRPAHTKVALYQRGVENGYLPIPSPR